ncbi:MAG: sugar ABC transporter substrate-binding protein [Solirubrobacterales bacterium]
MRIAVINSSDTNAYAHQVAVAVEEVAKARNAKVDVFNAEFDPGKQQAQFQDALATGRYDAYIVIPVDGVALIPMVKQAISSGAAVVATGDFALGPRYDTNEPQVEGMVGSVNTTNEAIGERLGNLAVEACEGDDECKIAWIPGVATTPAEVHETKVLKNVIEPHSNIELVAVQSGEFLADPSKRAASDILQAHSDLDVFVTAGDQMAYGAQLAIKDRGKSDQVKTIGLGGSFQGIEQIKAGEMFGTAPLLPYDDGLYAADIALRAVREQPIAKPVLDPVEASGIPTQLTKKNVGEVDFAGQFTNS